MSNQDNRKEETQSDEKGFQHEELLKEQSIDPGNEHNHLEKDGSFEKNFENKTTTKENKTS